MKLTDIPPYVCSSCGGQYPERRHVDFQAAWDGPTFREGVAVAEGDVRTNLTVAIDDLIICENCLRDAGMLVGLDDAHVLHGRFDVAQEKIRDLSERLAGQADYIAKLEAAAAARGRLEETLGRPHGKGRQRAVA